MAIQSSAALQSASGTDANSIRDTIRFSAAYGPVADELESFARSVRHTIAVRRAASAQEALAAYDLAKGLVRKPSGADLVAHVSDIRKTMKRGGSKKRAAPPSTATS